MSHLHMLHVDSSHRLQCLNGGRVFKSICLNGGRVFKIQACILRLINDDFEAANHGTQ